MSVHWSINKKRPVSTGLQNYNHTKIANFITSVPFVEAHRPYNRWVFQDNGCQLSSQDTGLQDTDSHSSQDTRTTGYGFQLAFIG